MKSIVEKSLKDTAIKHGISVEKVKEEISKAIKIEREYAEKSGKNSWKEIKEDITPEELIELLLLRFEKSKWK